MNNNKTELKQIREKMKLIREERKKLRKRYQFFKKKENEIINLKQEKLKWKSQIL